MVANCGSLLLPNCRAPKVADVHVFSVLSLKSALTELCMCSLIPASIESIPIPTLPNLFILIISSAAALSPTENTKSHPF